MKTINASAIKLILVTLFILIGRSGGAEHSITLSKITNSFDGHSTTRTTVRRVFRHDGYWYVFCGDMRNGVHYNFFVTSMDGVNWSKRKVGSGGGITRGQYGAPNLPETAIVSGDQIYGCYSEKGELLIRSGTVSNGDITWTHGHCIAPAYVDKSTQNFYGYYPDIMIDEDGFLSISLRHFHKRKTTPRLDPAFLKSTSPNYITAWQTPRDLVAFESAERLDAHENIPLPGGKHVVIVRTYSGVTDEQLYKPGWPGNFYAVHYDGAKWLDPVDLGDSDGINGSDKRLAGMLDPGTGIVHLLYIENSGTHWKNILRHRTLCSPYSVHDWSKPTTIATNVFTITLGMDTSTVPARIAAVYGNQLHEGGEVEPIWGSRWHTGKLYLKWYDGSGWESDQQLISDNANEYAWYPSIEEDVSGDFGVLYMKGGFKDFRNTPKELMFSAVKVGHRDPQLP